MQISQDSNRCRVGSYQVGRSALKAEVESVVKHPRLPVWPAWFGLVYILIDLVTGNPSLGAKLENVFGGRVCPMFFRNKADQDPFLLCVHHRHSFAFLDPFRYIFRLLLPEGFPAHPHRGFETVTYVLRGGLVHRDSFGVKKSYGAPPDATGSGDQAAVQWMTAGRGLQHEEMWRTGEATESTDQELYQIWVNLPARSKMVPPRMQLLGTPEGSEDASSLRSSNVEVRELGPVPHAQPAAGVSVWVVSGEAAGVSSPIETYSDMAILHIKLEAGVSWSWPRPCGWSCMTYVRQGEAIVGGTQLPVHSTATIRQSPVEDEVSFVAGEEGADLLLLSGAPLREPVEMGGNIVMNSPMQLAIAERDLAGGIFGPSWRHTLDDDEWKEQVKEHWAMVRPFQAAAEALPKRTPTN